jgi:hypothetical protein
VHPEYTEDDGVPRFGLDICFARGSLALSVTSLRRFESLYPMPEQIDQRRERESTLLRRVSRAPRSRGSRKRPSNIPEFASPSIGPIRYLILLHRQHTSKLVAKVACRSLVCVARLVTQPGCVPVGARNVSHDPQLRKESG